MAYSPNLLLIWLAGKRLKLTIPPLTFIHSPSSNFTFYYIFECLSVTIFNKGSNLTKPVLKAVYEPIIKINVIKIVTTGFYDSIEQIYMNNP